VIWFERWRALSARVDGLIRAGEFLAAAYAVHGADDFRVVERMIMPELEEITREIEQLGAAHGSGIPENARGALRDYIAQSWPEQASKLANTGKINIQLLAPLAAFRSRFEYLIQDSEVEGRSRTDLAFEHLRRQLVVVEDTRQRWLTAFMKHETLCEKLGAVHLLSHAIWAFKAAGARAATDLVFGDPVDNYATLIRRTARALVLTEWKLVERPEDFAPRAAEARAQAELYAGGILGDIELKRTKYVVLVCRFDRLPPDDVVAGSVSYRHVVLPLATEPPSRAARQRRG
jgi:hypothetical protein